MKKIIIIGCPGSGKTYFAKELAEILNKKVFHMDNLYWNKDRTHISRDELVGIIDEIMEQSDWIIDGNYISTIEQRIKEADTIFYFDYSTEDCLEGIKSRVVVKRDDIPWIESELDADFEKFVLDFRKETAPQIDKLLKAYRDKKINRFICRGDKEKYIMELKENLGNMNTTTHIMRLNNRPFQLIYSGNKTIELRLFDEKRQLIKAGDIIKFINTADENNTLLVEVVELHIYKDFIELYNNLPLLKCGYTEQDIDSADPKHMEKYYSQEQQSKYGVVGIEIKVVGK
ncbi:MAG: ASCH domain-containing protein [Eubacterium sp.]